MKRTIMIILGVVAGLTTFAQANDYGLTDDLLQNKQDIVAKYIPMNNGQYLYKFYVLPPEELLKKLDAFKQELSKQIASEADQATKALMIKDGDYFAKNILSWYTSLYGMDSLGMKMLEKVAMEKKDDPDFSELYLEARKKAFPVQLSAEERTRLMDRVDGSPELNDEALFKRSAAYRKWLDSYLMKLIGSKYKMDTALGYEGRHVAKLSAVKGEVSNPFMKEYLNFETTATILKMVKNDTVKEDAYKNFLSVATNPIYKKALQTIYENFQNMISNAPAPNFTYMDVDGETVSLKDLRGKYVYIDVWATWCAPCKAEIPFLTQLEEDYKDRNIHFVSLSVDRLADKPKWISYVKDNKLPGIQIMADKDFDSDFIKKFNINAIPRFILIDPVGKIVSGDAKRPSDPELRKQLDELLK